MPPALRRAPARALVIQTAFIGDAVLATPVAQQLRAWNPQAEIHFLARQDAAPLLANHPAIDRVHVWQKGPGKTRRLLELARRLRGYRFDLVVNLQRHWGTAFLVATLRKDLAVSFEENALFNLIARGRPHIVGSAQAPGPHETQRNLSLLEPLGLPFAPDQARPRLYPSADDYAKVAEWRAMRPYIVMAPASVKFTKQWPEQNWRTLISLLKSETKVFLIGSKADIELCERIAGDRPNLANLAGRLTLLQSAALMDGAARAVVNDSAPMHLAGAMNTPTDALYLSTSPAFGFGPLADGSQTWEADGLPCKPCGLAGRDACPQGHFRCASGVEIDALAAQLRQAVAAFSDDVRK